MSVNCKITDFIEILNKRLKAVHKTGIEIFIYGISIKLHVFYG